MKHLVPVAALSLFIGLAACGGSGNGSSTSNHNQAIINQAQGQDTSDATARADVLSKAASLNLHTVNSVANSFDISTGQCSIDNAGSTSASNYYGPNNYTLVSPDGKEYASVNTFTEIGGSGGSQQTPLSDCLTAVKNALGW